jgi:hypothetical protein
MKTYNNITQILVWGMAIILCPFLVVWNLLEDRCAGLGSIMFMPVVLLQVAYWFAFWYWVVGIG